MHRLQVLPEEVKREAAAKAAAFYLVGRMERGYDIKNCTVEKGGNYKEYMDENATSYDVIEQKTSNAKAREAFDVWQSKLLQGLIMLGNIFDPEMIVLSGSLSKFIEYEKLNKQANDQILTQPFILKEATFENNAGMLGVAMLFFSKM